jgi:hypothetical protein
MVFSTADGRKWTQMDDAVGGDNGGGIRGLARQTLN